MEHKFEKTSNKKETSKLTDKHTLTDGCFGMTNKCCKYNPTPKLFFCYKLILKNCLISCKSFERTKNELCTWEVTGKFEANGKLDELFCFKDSNQSLIKSNEIWALFYKLMSIQNYIPFSQMQRMKQKLHWHWIN